MYHEEYDCNGALLLGYIEGDDFMEPLYSDTLLSMIHYRIQDLLIQ